jgi:hypothetical protein
METTGNFDQTMTKSSLGTSQMRSIFQLVSSIIIFIVGSSSIFSIVGFFVIHSYIASISVLSPLNIDIIQYTSAGLNALVGSIAIVVSLLLPGATFGLVVGLSVVLSVFVLYLILLLTSKRSAILKGTINIVDNKLGKSLHVTKIVSLISIVFWGLFFSFIIISTIFTAINYGQNNYAESPRYVGGGVPAEAILVFYEEQSELGSFWGVTVSSANSRMSETVLILMELTDGLLIRDVTTNVVSIVKNDMIQAIIDAPQFLSAFTATPAPQPTTQP